MKITLLLLLVLLTGCTRTILNESIYTTIDIVEDINVIIFNPNASTTNQFSDDFNRSDGAVGNGWEDNVITPSTPATVIVSNELVRKGIDASKGTSTIAVGRNEVGATPVSVIEHQIDFKFQVVDDLSQMVINQQIHPTSSIFIQWQLLTVGAGAQQPRYRLIIDGVTILTENISALLSNTYYTEKVRAERTAQGYNIKFKLWETSTTEPASWDYETDIPETAAYLGNKFELYINNIKNNTDYVYMDNYIGEFTSL